MSPPAGKGRGKEGVTDPLLAGLFSGPHVKPLVASGGGAWRRHAASVPAARNLPPLFWRILEDVPSNSRSFGVL